MVSSGEMGGGAEVIQGSLGGGWAGVRLRREGSFFNTGSKGGSGRGRAG